MGIYKKNKSGELDARSAKRLFEAGKYHEQQYRRTPEIPQGPREAVGAVMFHLTTALSRMAGTPPIPGGGSGKMQMLDGTGAYVDISSTTYPITNNTTQAVSSGAYVLCVPAYGKWTWIMTSCASVTP